jgi:hypothetical protein
MREIARILQPSANALMTAICFSLGRVFAIALSPERGDNVLRFILTVNTFCVTISSVRNSCRMADILFRFEAIAATPNAVALTKNMVIAMSTIQSEIERATTQNNWILAGYILALVIAAAMTLLSWRAGNRVQDLVRKDADARIAEADSKAAVANENAGKANERAGVANAEAARANEGLARSNVEIAQLTAETEKAKAERAEADKQIAIAKADAARAKEGIANAEARSLEASAEVSRLRVTVANAETARAKAEKDLLELQERIKPRQLGEQKKPLVARLRALPKGDIEVRCPAGSPEAHHFARELAGAFTEAGWNVTFRDNLIMVPTPMNLQLWLHTDQELAAGKAITEQGPERAFSILDAFKLVNLPLEGHFNRDVPKDAVWLIVGFKP